MKLNYPRILAKTVGIISHVDAGKTTLTENILYHAGLLAQPGSIIKGTTTTDYLKVEKDRGITINSVNVGFKWKGFSFNLIDTPGHVDFQFEVHRSLAALDLAIVVVDSCKGVEPQTFAYFAKCLEMKIPCLFFANKIDMEESNIDQTINSICNELDIDSAIINHPKIVENIQLLTKNNEIGEKKPYKVAYKNQEEILKNLSEIAQLLEPENHDESTYFGPQGMNIKQIASSLKKSFLALQFYPVIIGSAKFGSSISFLLDTVLYLSSDKDKNEKSEDSYSLGVALNFKSQKTSDLMSLDFFKVMQGSFRKDMLIYSNNLNLKKQKMPQIFQCQSKETFSVEEVIEGDIFAIPKSDLSIETGDFLLTSPPDEKVKAKLNSMPKIVRPVPIYYCNIEPEKSSEHGVLLKALNDMKYFDGAMSVEVDPKDDQISVGGIGKVHMEIIETNLKDFYRINAKILPPETSVLKIISQKSSLITEMINGSNESQNDNYELLIQLRIVPLEMINGAFQKQKFSMPDNVNLPMDIKNSIKTTIDSFSFAYKIRNVGVMFDNFIWQKHINCNRINILLFECLEKLYPTLSIDFEEPAVKLKLEIRHEKHKSLIEKEVSRRGGYLLSDSGSSLFRNGICLVFRGSSRKFFDFSSTARRLCQGFIHIEVFNDDFVYIDRETAKSMTI
ncbi:MAG: G elongation factor, mitochondrial 2 [Paramarteilia canceri]